MTPRRPFVPVSFAAAASSVRGTPGSARVRSGLIRVQLRAASVDL
jgi:hypothetical protein